MQITSSTRLGIVLSLCLILSAHVEPTIRAQPDWSGVAWIPFVSPPVKLRDIVQNVLLFVPFGYFLAVRCDARWSKRCALAVVLVAAALSAALEALQLFVPERFPSTTDIVCNAAGAAIGLSILLFADSARSPQA